MMKLHYQVMGLVGCVLGIFSTASIADGLAIDKVYHPYVHPLEMDIEWRSIFANGEQKQRVAVGSAVTDKLFIEGYIISSNDEISNRVTSYELEALWQLTDQGEYEVDWAVVMELEKTHHHNAGEFALGVLAEKEWGRIVGTANLWALYEWSDVIQNDLESALALQVRYRYARFLEPALEFYSGKLTRGLGPVLMGDVKVAAGKKIHWEAGAIIGLDSKTPSTTWRLLAEFEF